MQSIMDIVEGLPTWLGYRLNDNHHAFLQVSFRVTTD